MGRDGDGERTINLTMPVHSGEVPQRNPVKIHGVPIFVVIIMTGLKPMAFGPWPSYRAAEQWIAKEMPGHRFNSNIVELMDPDEVADDATS